MGLASSRPVGLPAASRTISPPGGVGRVLGVADGAQRRAVQHRPVVEMQQKDRRIGRDRVELLDRRQALFGELVLGEAADHAHPLRRRRDGDLALQHGHGVGKAAHAVPAQLHVEVQPAADDVQVVIDQAGQNAPALQIDDLGRGPASCMTSWSRPTAEKMPSLIATAFAVGLRAVERGEQAVRQDEIGRSCRSSFMSVVSMRA